MFRHSVQVSACVKDVLYGSLRVYSVWVSACVSDAPVQISQAYAYMHACHFWTATEHRYWYMHVDNSYMRAYYAVEFTEIGEVRYAANDQKC